MNISVQITISQVGSGVVETVVLKNLGDIGAWEYTQDFEHLGKQIRQLVYPEYESEYD